MRNSTFADDGFKWCIAAGQFQGPALTIAFEGAVLSTEEVCILQASPPAKLHGHSCQYGSGLLGAYHLTSLPFIVSGGYLYLFDPSGQILASSLADGRAAPSGSPAGKAYVLKGNLVTLLTLTDWCPPHPKLPI